MDTTVCPVWVPPHVGGTLSSASPVCVEVNGVPIARLADFASCLLGLAPDVVAEGASMVLVCGLPVARMGDKTIHGGAIVIGSTDVEVGGPTFALPPNVTIKGPPEFTNKTLRDMYKLSTLPSGQKLLDDLAATGEPVVIVPESDPHNSFCKPNLFGGGSTVSYNPDIAIYVEDAKGDTLCEPPQVVLGHELVHSLHNADGVMDPPAPDPSTNPPTEPDIPPEEGATIGTGAWTGDEPTENSIRRDLHMRPRADHLGFTTDKNGNELTAPCPGCKDLRPGDC
jgi:uncharacterized Zn-binding protein involved in type VI secretion